MTDEAKQEVISMSVVELVTVSATKATGGGRKCSAKLNVTQHDAAILMERMGQQTYSAQFGGKTLGDGLTIGGVTGKPDDEGNPTSALTLNGSQGTVSTMAKFMEKCGQVSSLVLTQEQMTMFPADDAHEDNPEGKFEDAES